MFAFNATTIYCEPVKLEGEYMDSSNNGKNLRILIILSVLTAIGWNAEIFLSVVSAVLPGNVMHQSILSRDNQLSVFIFMVTAMLIQILPVVLLIYCAAKLRANKFAQSRITAYQRNWLGVLLALNILFCIMLAGFFMTSGTIPHPGFRNIL